MGFYFFDFNDGDDQFTDEVGLEASSGEEALREAVAALSRMAGDCQSPVNGQVMRMTIRDDAGHSLYQVTNTMAWTALSEGGPSA
jgi:hypothetical protein